ncbi:cysteine--tRNA ligase [archaeon]|nr:cysteine--tRNA ligase [archaeon]
MKFYNSLTKQKEEFQSLNEKEVTMYNCGPTVYFYIHIGNARAFVFSDILRRWLEYRDYTVKQVMNITDVGHMTQDEDIDSTKGEDKLEKEARKEKKDPWQIADFYTKAFLEDSKALKIKEAFAYPKATETIQEMIELIQKLIDNGHAYVVDRNVYYDVTSFPDYGKLSGNTIEQLKAGARLDVNEEKKNPFDFALWVHNPNHIMQWDSPWGKGYPGWHVECSAMSMKYLGKTIDIHTGGEDNIFPHHECEIAQSEGANECEFVKYWMHTRFLLVDGEKMSKSKGNFFTVKDILEKGYSALALRYVLVSAQYRTPMNFSFASLKSAEETLARLKQFMIDLEKSGKGEENEGVNNVLIIAYKEIERSMDDDLNTPAALAAVFDAVKELTKYMEKGIGSNNKKEIEKFMKDIEDMFGIVPAVEEQKISSEERNLIDEREEARKRKDFKTSDAIRDRLAKKGIVLEDSPDGVKWKRV